MILHTIKGEFKAWWNLGQLLFSAASTCSISTLSTETSHQPDIYWHSRGCASLPFLLFGSTSLCIDFRSMIDRSCWVCLSYRDISLIISFLERKCWSREGRRLSGFWPVYLKNLCLMIIFHPLRLPKYDCFHDQIPLIFCTSKTHHRFISHFCFCYQIGFDENMVHFWIFARRKVWAGSFGWRGQFLLPFRFYLIFFWEVGCRLV